MQHGPAKDTLEYIIVLLVQSGNLDPAFLAFSPFVSLMSLFYWKELGQQGNQAQSTFTILHSMLPKIKSLIQSKNGTLSSYMPVYNDGKSLSDIHINPSGHNDSHPSTIAASDNDAIQDQCTTKKRHELSILRPCVCQDFLPCTLFLFPSANEKFILVLYG